MKPIRILHIYKDFRPYSGGGGVPRHIAGIARITLEHGYQLSVAAPVADTDAGNGRYQVQRIRLGQLDTHVRDADIVHIHGARTPIALLAGLCAHRQSKRLVYTPHCYYENDTSTTKRLAKRAWDLVAERWLLRRADATVLLADFWLEHLRKRGLKVARPVVLPNCVLAEELPRHTTLEKKLDGRPSLLSVGRLDSVKRLDDAIRVLTQPGLEQANLHLVGSGPDRARLQSLTTTLGLNARVHFHGFVSDAEVACMAAAADAFLLPSAVEGMPTVLIEMLLHGCPVLASDIPGNRAILEGVGQPGALYPLADISSLATSILSLSPARVSAEQRQRTLEQFTWEGMRARIKALYAGVMAD